MVGEGEGVASGSHTVGTPPPSSCPLATAGSKSKPGGELPGDGPTSTAGVGEQFWMDPQGGNYLSHGWRTARGPVTDPPVRPNADPSSQRKWRASDKSAVRYWPVASICAIGNGAEQSDSVKALPCPHLQPSVGGWDHSGVIESGPSAAQGTGNLFEEMAKIHTF